MEASIARRSFFGQTNWWLYTIRMHGPMECDFLIMLKAGTDPAHSFVSIYGTKVVVNSIIKTCLSTLLDLTGNDSFREID